MWLYSAGLGLMVDGDFVEGFEESRWNFMGVAHGGADVLVAHWLLAYGVLLTANCNVL